MSKPKFQVGEQVIPIHPCLLMAGVIQSFEPVDATENEWQYVILLDKHPAITQIRVIRREHEIEGVYQFGVGAAVAEYNRGIGSADANKHLTV